MPCAAHAIQSQTPLAQCLTRGFKKRLESQGDVSSTSANDDYADDDQIVDVRFDEVQIPHFYHEFAVYLSLVRRTDCRKLCVSGVASATQPLSASGSEGGSRGKYWGGEGQDKKVDDLFKSWPLKHRSKLYTKSTTPTLHKYNFQGGGTVQL